MGVWSHRTAEVASAAESSSLSVDNILSILLSILNLAAASMSYYIYSKVRHAIRNNDATGISRIQAFNHLETQLKSILAIFMIPISFKIMLNSFDTLHTLLTLSSDMYGLRIDILMLCALLIGAAISVIFLCLLIYVSGSVKGGWDVTNTDADRTFTYHMLTVAAVHIGMALSVQAFSETAMEQQPFLYLCLNAFGTTLVSLRFWIGLRSEVQYPVDTALIKKLSKEAAQRGCMVRDQAAAKANQDCNAG